MTFGDYGLQALECGWITAMNLPCPTCGMTTAFAHAANGDMLASLGTQPLGFVLAIATAMSLLLGTYVAATGSRLEFFIDFTYLMSVLGVVMLLGSCVYFLVRQHRDSELMSR